jgi:hypothetical protein
LSGLGRSGLIGTEQAVGDSVWILSVHILISVAVISTTGVVSFAKGKFLGQMPQLMRANALEGQQWSAD